MGASAAIAVIEKSVWKPQSAVRSLDAYAGCAVPRLTLLLQFGLGPWRSWDMRSADLSQVVRTRGQRVSAESERATAKRD